MNRNYRFLVYIFSIRCQSPNIMDSWYFEPSRLCVTFQFSLCFGNGIMPFTSLEILATNIFLDSGWKILNPALYGACNCHVVAQVMCLTSLTCDRYLCDNAVNINFCLWWRCVCKSERSNFGIEHLVLLLRCLKFETQILVRRLRILVGDFRGLLKFLADYCIFMYLNIPQPLLYTFFHFIICPSSSDSTLSLSLCTYIYIYFTDIAIK